ncbi:tumor necrosis factor ligand superfamily member 6-like [Branchiostoma floridae]|uniref:Tumor necrosis factor ligand superfamily member 6-like n=1 Tax=Branchiostoma floridae TaxID=7739 RepID=A0A9J7M3U4_BRAFL|nr:tumor necrosis factor ligand superfamily member 6-like [Branchiostoma floridae]
MHDVESNKFYPERKRPLRLYCCYGVLLLLWLTSVAASLVSLTLTLQERQAFAHGNGPGSSTSTQTVSPDGPGRPTPCTSRDCLPWQLPAVGDVIERNTSFYLPVALLAGRTGLQSATAEPARIYDWQAGGGGASYMAHGMRYSPEEGSLVVPLTGYYNIYCQVQFTHIPQEGAPDTGSPHLSFSVYQLPRSPPAYRIMTSGGTVHTVLEGGAWAKTFYVEGVFRLQARDHLYVTVSDLDRVNPYEYATYFGAFLVSR